MREPRQTSSQYNKLLQLGQTNKVTAVMLCEQRKSLGALPILLLVAGLQLDVFDVQ